MKYYVKKLFLCVVMTLSLCACGRDVKNVQIETVPSEIYSEKDIKSAMKTVIREFDWDWTLSGCTLTSISYAGDEITLHESEYYLQQEKLYDADELIVLLSSFDVDETGGDGSLNPNFTYSDYNWILIRSNGGRWKLVDNGY